MRNKNGMKRVVYSVRDLQPREGRERCLRAWERFTACTRERERGSFYR